MNKRAPLLLFVIVLALLGIVALIFWHSIRAAFVAPLSAFFMMIADILGSFDQIFLWGVLLFVLILGTISRLGKTKPEAPQTRAGRLRIGSTGRLRFWETQVYLLTHGRVPSRYAIHEIRRLLVTVMGYKLHLDTAETERRLKSGELTIPSEYKEFSTLEQEQGSEEPDDQLTVFFKKLVSMLQGKQQQEIQVREKVLSDLILYMEKQMEIEHDH